MLPSDGQTQDQCGKQCEIQGNTVVISSWYGNDDKGEAWVWQLNGDEWTELAMLRASDGDVADIFGRSATLDGDTVVVGDDCPADIDGNGEVGVDDLLEVIADWGVCP